LLVNPGWPSLRCVFPRVPVRPKPFNEDGNMPTRYEITMVDLDRAQDDGAIRSFREPMAGCIASERERDGSFTRMCPAAISQGGAMAIARSLNYPERLAGPVVLARYDPLAASLEGEQDTGSHGSPPARA
jgi:predicted esterase